MGQVSTFNDIAVPALLSLLLYVFIFILKSVYDILNFFSVVMS